MATATRKRTTRKGKATPAEREEAAKARQAEASELHREIALRVQTLSESQEWMNYLDFMKGFHTYSFNNIMLMMAQRIARGQDLPTHVAGFKAWQNNGRQVRKGERGLRIFGFRQVLVTDDKGEPVLDDKGRKQFRPFWPVVSVFDIDQTDPIEGADKVFDPEVAHPPLVTGADHNGLTLAVSCWLDSIGWSFSLEPIAGQARGYTTTDGTKRVVVSSEVEPAMQAKTALHEMAHVILHVDGDGNRMEDAPSQAVRELEAESAAYVAGAILGLDTAAYSERYLLGWSEATGQPANEAIKATATRVQKAVQKMVRVIGGEGE